MHRGLVNQYIRIVKFVYCILGDFWWYITFLKLVYWYIGPPGPQPYFWIHVSQTWEGFTSHLSGWHE